MNSMLWCSRAESSVRFGVGTSAVEMSPSSSEVKIWSESFRTSARESRRGARSELISLDRLRSQAHESDGKSVSKKLAEAGTGGSGTTVVCDTTTSGWRKDASP
jgi:hypothetical protein